MQSTEIIYRVTENLSNIINQINSKLTIDTDIIEMSKQIDLLLVELMSDIEKSN
ncbi:hypothetical protein [Vallitalea sp.]|jgi:hypothetical protein|uniref:hypothetical protein n=1 Tax=Vallitalea sp. TaxID=1882829 RepID=UPI0025F2E731|nr:hypothetical protein [Vallitalea sp.]MCT4685738.1 hypothetical protein [Vallitalea sp.]